MLLQGPGASAPCGAAAHGAWRRRCVRQAGGGGAVPCAAAQQRVRQHQQRQQRLHTVVARAVAAAPNLPRGPAAEARSQQPQAPPLAPAPPALPLSFEGRAGIYDSQGRLMLKSLTLSELEEWCESIGEARRRGMQLWRWMYADGCWAGAPEDTVGVQNGLSPAFCEKIRGVATFDGGLRLESVARARDGTRKLVFKITAGEGKGASIEAVLIPVIREAGSKPRITLCVSSQVGCAMACQFCLTGRLGLAANLGPAQILEQMVAARRLQAQEGDPVPITNVVFMGMGEPLHNLGAVAVAAEVMNHPLGLHVSHNKVTVSTVGLVDQIDEFVARCGGAQLAVSLHATTDEVRDWIVPVNNRHDLSSLLGALARHYPRGNAAKRRVLIEYVMLAGVNDTLEDAQRLVDLLEPIEAKVNLIQFNPHEGTRFRRSPMEQVLAFRSVVIKGGRVCTIRDSRGDDELAACGQLGDVAQAARPARPLRPPEKFLGALAGVEGGDGAAAAAGAAAGAAAEGGGGDSCGGGGGSGAGAA